MSNPAQQLKQCQNGWSAFTTRENREWYLKGLRRGAEICRDQYPNTFQAKQRAFAAEKCARAIEAEIPPPPTKPVVREGGLTSSVSHGKQYAKKPPQG